MYSGQNVDQLLCTVFLHPFTSLCGVTYIICSKLCKSEVGVLFNRQDHIGTGPQHCHLWVSNPLQS